MLRIAAAFTLVACAAPSRAIAQSQPHSPASQPAAGSGPHLTVLVSPLVDMHFYLRSLAAREREADVPEPFRPGVAAVHELEQAMGPVFGWSFIEGQIYSVQSAREMHENFDKLPGRVHRRDGLAIKARQPARALSRVYLEMEPLFLKELWPQRREQIEAARARIEQNLLPRQAECLADICEKIAMPLAPIEIPVVLVADGPPPQGFTHQRRGGAVCFVGVAGLDDSLLYEVVLHEATHALDAAAGNAPTALMALDEKLVARGFRGYSPVRRDVPHTIFFVQAADTVRRLLNPAHEDYGDVRGYYGKIPDAVAAVRPNWNAFLRGEISRDEALERIVQALPAPQTQTRPAAPHNRGQRERP